MNIPDSAITAALNAYRAPRMHPDQSGDAVIARLDAALQAAAPFIAAQAVWDATLQIDTHQFGPYAAPYISAVRDQLRACATEVPPQ